jgi:hypothetical protein
LLPFLFLLYFLKQTQATRFEKVSELGYADRQNPSGGSNAGYGDCGRAGDACWTHYDLL